MNDCTGVVSQLFVYPVKSCAGIAISTSRIDATGLAWDRAWMIVDQDGNFVTQRQIPHMCWIETRLSDSALTLCAPGLSPLTIAFDHRGHRCRVTVWRDSVEAGDMGDTAAQWLDAFLAVPGRRFRLVRFTDSDARVPDLAWTGGVRSANLFSDGFPVLVVSQGAIDELNRRLLAAGSEPVSVSRFRPNIVLSGIAAHDEDQLDQVVFKTACGELSLRLVKPCSRCTIPDIQPHTAMSSGDVSRTLSGYRGLPSMGGAICFGMNAIVHAGAGRTLHTGMPFEAGYRF